jgi:hypothetical protein
MTGYRPHVLVWLIMIPVALLIGPPMIRFVVGSYGNSKLGISTPYMYDYHPGEVMSIDVDGQATLGFGSCMPIEALVNGQPIVLAKERSQLLNSCSVGALPADYFESFITVSGDTEVVFVSGEGTIGVSSPGRTILSIDITGGAIYHTMWWIFMAFGYVVLCVLGSLAVSEIKVKRAWPS